MVGRISGATGQLKYMNNSGDCPEENRFAEDMRENTGRLFFFKSCAFFCCLK